jgi:hypothetical protein
VLDKQGKNEEAEAMHRRTLEGFEEVLGCEHPHTLTSVINLGLVLDRQGNTKRQKRCIDGRWRGVRRCSGVSIPPRSSVSIILAQCSAAKGNHDLRSLFLSILTLRSVSMFFRFLRSTQEPQEAS